MTSPLTRWLERLERRHPRSIDLGLERCGQVYQRLGSPRPGGKVVTIAGTNGKGSTVAWCSSLLQAQGVSVSAYTSPHIFRFNERLQIQGMSVSDSDWVFAFEAVEKARGQISLTYFEFTTLAAFLISSLNAPDVALLEVGLGGRLDTVNLVDADLAVIMPIGLDHQAFLGDDRETIGSEKAGVLRSGQKVVLAEDHPPQSVLERVGQLGCQIRRAGRDYDWDADESRVHYRIGEANLSLLPLPLAGEHQLSNLGASLAAVSWLYPECLRNPAEIQEGVASVQLAGRLQSHQNDQRVVMDVGHNAHAAKAIADFLEHQQYGRCLCVIGMLKDKSAETVAELLQGHVDEWFCAGLPGERGQQGDVLAGRIQTTVPDAVINAFTSVAGALEAARHKAGDDDLVLVFGSFETISQASVAMEGHLTSDR